MLYTFLFVMRQMRLQKDVRDRVSWDLDRSSAKDKLRDILDWDKNDMKPTIQWQVTIKLTVWFLLLRNY